MPPLPARPSSLCLFCAFAARPRSHPQRLLPRSQLAHRSEARGKRGNANGHYNPRAPIDPFRSPLKHTSSPTAVRNRLKQLRLDLSAQDFLDSLQLSREDFDKEWLTFERSINQWIEEAPPELIQLAGEDLRGKKTLEMRLRYRFYAQTYGGRFTQAELENQKEVADLRYPSEWYPATRELARTVHLHVGPTNSGKTYHALKRLEAAETGIYLGPLRLLAHEVYTRLNAKGKRCALVTGEELRLPDGDEPSAMYSCTVEMAPLNTHFEVAVVDEIQMISHGERGWGWTQAFLGLQAKEIHLCGEARTVPLIRELCALVGDTVHVHEYERLTPLKVQPRSLRGRLNELEKGDCIVAFSVMAIHALRREVERKTGKKCAMVYGSLPPETRAQQARLFNDPDNDYDFLVASDAIGMGLNLAIKRVIFESTIKNNGVAFVPLQISEIKQIAGRAGRYKTAHQAISQDSAQITVPENVSDPVIGLDDVKQESSAEIVGWVTTLDDADHDHLKIGLNQEPEEITSAGLFPPSLIVERFANYFPPGTPFSYIMLRLHEISEIHPRFHLCALKDQLAIADCIHTVKDLSIQDRITICAAPINMKEEPERKFLRALAECIADGKSGSLLDLDHIPLQIMDKKPSGSRSYLYSLESLHKMLVCYLWLSYRFPNVFTTRPLANYIKKLVEDQIEETLTSFSLIEQARERQRKTRDQARKQIEEQGEGALAPQGEVRRVQASSGNVRRFLAPLDMTAEAKDVVNGGQLSEDPAPSTDDAGKYLDNLPAAKLDSHAKKHQHSTVQLSDEVGDLFQSRLDASGRRITSESRI